MTGVNTILLDLGGVLSVPRPLRSLLGDRIRQHVKAVVAIGEATKRITRSLAGIKSVEAMGSLQEAVRYAQRMASAGDVVLFSPSCSSFDMFRNYDHRGKEFKRLVHELPDIG